MNLNSNLLRMKRKKMNLFEFPFFHLYVSNFSACKSVNMNKSFVNNSVRICDYYVTALISNVARVWFLSVDKFLDIETQGQLWTWFFFVRNIFFFFFKKKRLTNFFLCADILRSKWYWRYVHMHQRNICETHVLRLKYVTTLSSLF